MSTDQPASTSIGGTSISLPKEIANNYVQKSTIGNYFYTLQAYAKHKEIEFFFQNTISEKLLKVKKDITIKHSKLDEGLVLQTFETNYDEEDAQADEIDKYELENPEKVQTANYNVFSDKSHPTFRKIQELNYSKNLRDAHLKIFQKRVQKEHHKRNIAESIGKVTTDYEKEERES